MAWILEEGFCTPIRVSPQSDGQIFISIHILSLKFGFKQDSISLKDEIFDESEELSCTIAIAHSTNKKEKIWMLRSSSYCEVGVMPTLLEFTSVVSSKFAFKIRIVDNIQGLEPELNHLDDSKIEFVACAIPSMYSG